MTASGRPCGQPALAASPSSPVPGLAPAGFDQAYRSRSFANCLASSLNTMIETQMAAYPESWSAADKREMAELHLFGRRNSTGEPQ